MCLRSQNYSCKWCQNWDLDLGPPEAEGRLYPAMLHSKRYASSLQLLMTMQPALPFPNHLREERMLKYSAVCSH